ncbi:MAG: hypothetical protein CMF50_05640 [Legionellales bacterium]|nr:hypothetical protein [Legionellales bacterium]
MSEMFFARWFALISLALSLGILFNLDDARQMARGMVERETGYIMGGVQPIIFGSLAFMHHHSFEIGWTLVVDLIGLLMVLLGLYRVLFVRHWKKTMQRHIDKIPPLFSLFGLMIGLLLLYVGFFSSLVYYSGAN